MNNISRNAVMLSCASYVPERVISNQYFDNLLGENVSDWLEKNVQIFERRWCEENQSVSDLCIAAAHKALERAGLKADQLDLIIIATDTPEFVSPSTASKVQHLLGAKKAGTFDVNTACAGFVTAMDIASKYIKADERYEYVLVIGAYAMSKYLNMQDKKTVTLFADGAGAVILGATNEEGRGVLSTRMHTEGQYHSWMGIYGGQTYKPISDEVLAEKDHMLKFVHKFPSELNPETWSALALEMSRQLDVQPDEVDHYFLTQININSIKETMEKLGVSMKKAPTVMHRFGYTGSACIPMALDQAASEGKLRKGDLLYFIGSGGGLAFASLAMRL
jgi:3-oxoacyl-[acyl-carrier-protein] synthase III